MKKLAQWCHVISNEDEVIDSRDVIARIEELEAELRSAFDDIPDDIFDDWLKSQDANEDVYELLALRKLALEAEDYSDDWEHGSTLIRKSYFVEYCKELMRDIGELPKDMPSYIIIDWEATAENLKVDYIEVDYNNVTYLIR